jgi:hypothetical protein
MEDLVDPEDEAQREQVRVLLDTYGNYISEARKDYYRERRELAASLHVRLASLLNAEQQARLDDWAEREGNHWGKYDKHSKHDAGGGPRRDK